METMKKVNNFLDRYEPFIFLGISFVFLISLLSGDVEGMVGSGIISTWLRIERMEKRIKNERTNSV